jgi:hypothetical protein
MGKKKAAAPEATEELAGNPIVATYTVRITLRENPGGEPTSPSIEGLEDEIGRALTAGGLNAVAQVEKTDR